MNSNETPGNPKSDTTNTVVVETSLKQMEAVHHGSESGEEVDIKTLSSASYVSWRGYAPPNRVTGWVNVVFIIMADLIGTGIVNLPETFNRMGWAVGVVILTAFGLLTAYAGLLLWRLHMTYHDGVTYGNIAKSVSGKALMWLAFVIVYTHFFMKMANYLLAAAKAIQVAFWMKDVCLYYATLATLAFVVPLCQLRTLHQISYAGAFSVLMISITILLLLIQAYTTWDQIGAEGVEYNPLPMEKGTKGFLSAFSAMTSLVFAYGGQGMYLETMSEMRNPKDFPKALSVFMSIIIAFYLWSSLSLYFRYGDQTYQYVLFNMGDGAIKTVAAVCMFLHVLVSFCLNSQLLTRAIQVRLWPGSVNSEDKTEWLKWLAISGCTISLAWLISNAVPFFSDLEGLISSICVGPTTFGFPALFYLLACRQQGKRVPIHELLACLTMCFIAVFFVLVGTGVDVYQIVDNSNTFGKPFTCILGSISK